MEKPPYDPAALKDGIANIEKGIDRLNSAIMAAHQQKARAEEVISNVGRELTNQMERKAEYANLLKQHEKFARRTASVDS